MPLFNKLLLLPKHLPKRYNINNFSIYNHLILLIKSDDHALFKVEEIHCVNQSITFTSDIFRTELPANLDKLYGRAVFTYHKIAFFVVFVVIIQL